MNEVASIKVQFEKVCDGDTAYFLVDGKTTKVRFLVIDTPEIYPEEELFAREAMDYCEEMLSSAKEIILEFDDAVSRYDDTSEHRLLAWVFCDGVLLNARLVRLGLARVTYVDSPKLKYLDKLKKAQEFAKKRGKRLYYRKD
jgi:micrococcal nuclease